MDASLLGNDKRNTPRLLTGDKPEGPDKPDARAILICPLCHVETQNGDYCERCRTPVKSAETGVVDG